MIWWENIQMELSSEWREREPEVIGSKHARTWVSEKGKSFQVFNCGIFYKGVIPLKNRKLPPFSIEKRERFRYFFRKFILLLHAICIDHFLQGWGNGVLAAVLAAWYLHTWEIDTDREENVECSAQCLLKFN